MSKEKIKIGIPENGIYILFLVVMEIMLYIFKERRVAYYILSSAMAIVIMLMGRERIAYAAIFMIPNQRLFTIGDTEYSLVNILIVVLILYDVRYTIKSNAKLLGISLLVTSYAMAMTLYQEDKLLILHAIKTLSLIYGLNVVFQRLKGKNGLSYAFRFFSSPFIIGIFVAAVIGYLYEGGFTSEDIASKLRFSAGEYNNPNFLGFDISFALSLLILKLFAEQKAHIITSMLILTLLAFGMATKSRSFVFTTALIAIFYLLHTVIYANKRNIILSAFVIITTIILMQYGERFPKLLYDAALQRITEPEKGDVSSGRYDIWAQYIQYLANDIKVFTFGVGVEDIYEKVGVYHVAHNAVLEVLISWGVVGLLLYVYMFVRIMRVIRIGFEGKGPKTEMSYLKYLPMASLLMTSITGHSFISNPFVTKYFIACIAIYWWERR